MKKQDYNTAHIDTWQGLKLFADTIKTKDIKKTMARVDLNKIKLGYSPLTDTIYLYRHGKNPDHALDKREAESDVYKVIVQKLMHDAPNGSVLSISLGKDKFEVSCKPIKREGE